MLAFIFLALFECQRSWADSSTQITHLFQSLPTDILANFDGDFDYQNDRNKLLKHLSSITKVRDDKNGYLKLEDVESVELALFTRTNKSPILAISEGHGSTCELQFYEQEKSAWKEITKNVYSGVSTEYVVRKYRQKIPSQKKITSAKLESWAFTSVCYKLPRQGTTIIGVVGIDIEEGGKPLFELKYDHSGSFKAEP